MSRSKSKELCPRCGKDYCICNNVYPNDAHIVMTPEMMRFILRDEFRKKVGENFYWKMWAAKEIAYNLFVFGNSAIRCDYADYYCQILKKEWFR